MSWDEASAPGQFGRKDCVKSLATNLPTSGLDPQQTLRTGRPVPVGVWRMARREHTHRHPWSRALALGSVAWLSGYVVLPLAKVYKPIWKYDAKTLAQDLAGHLVYGAAVSAASRHWSDDPRKVSG